MSSSPARKPLDGRHFDVAILGGGINGVAIARECARAGRSTLIIERNDFASGTTSRSTRIIHGGLRYLEHGEIGLVRESLRERQRLLRERPNLVRPMQFVLAMPSGSRSAMQVRFGLWLYRRFAGTRAPGNDGLAEIERLLDAGGSDTLRMFAYEDAQCEFPERLTAEWLGEAMTCGCIARNHTSALQVNINNGRARGVRVRDLIEQAEYTVTAETIINATGPWADSVCKASGVRTHEPLLGGVRGSHLVLPRFAGAPSSAVYTEAVDGRPIFLVPWNGQILFGTTEVNDGSDPSRVQPSAAEIDYLTSSLKRLFPAAPLNEVSYAFAGVRPLPYAPGKNASAVTRRHFLHDHAEDGVGGMISVVGGKLTTAASLARECARKVGVSVGEPQGTAVAAGTAIEPAIAGAELQVASTGGLSPATARDLVSWFGAHSGDIARHAAEDARLRLPLSDVTNHVVAEAVYAVEHEAAVTLADILLRRVPVALGGEWSPAASRQAAERIGAALGWGELRIRREQEQFEQERDAFLIQPASTQLSLSA